TWIVPSPHALTLIMATGCCLFVAYPFGVVAMRTGEIPVVAPFRYATLLGALIYGYALWGHIPDPVSMVGIVMIVGAGLYTIYRERVSSREVLAAKPKVLKEVSA
ncbi:MAG: EamA/RhaT family transporter, partial [Hyphomicrobiaceae bacterium]